NTFPTFHASLLEPHVANDNNLFPSRAFVRSGPVFTAGGQEESFIDHISKKCYIGCGKQYLAQWLGYPPEHDEWIKHADLENCQAMDNWINEQYLNERDGEGVS
ncbi:hypothetical protein SERLA73DRAFT_63108, partial [Serpula lacrymans var. lacrymans S7.3]